MEPEGRSKGSLSEKPLQHKCKKAGSCRDLGCRSKESAGDRGVEGKQEQHGDGEEWGE